MQANIFKIQKSSLQDGPGRRTVIYFKGCPLRCAWCHSPQALNRPQQILWDGKRCLYCRLCESACPTDSLHFENNTLRFTPKTCTGCRACVEHCPSRMLHFVGKMMELDEIMDIILEDRELYGSEGGVTLSGGDPLMQPEFATALLKRCHQQGIHTMVETTCLAKPLAFTRLLAHTDTLLVDIKHYSERKHVQYTGASAQSILENLDFAISAGVDVIARITIVPGINDTPFDAGEFARLLTIHRVKRVIVARHDHAGTKKYEETHVSSLLPDSAVFTDGDLNRYAEILRGKSLSVELAR